VFGDDRVRSTREQMMLLQVDLVRLSNGAGIAWEFLYFMNFEINCNRFITQLLDIIIVFIIIVFGLYLI